MLRAGDILSTMQVRRMCGETGKPIDRHTLIAWRAKRGFPEPVRVIRQPKGQTLELWARADVKAWIKAHPHVN